MIVFRCDATPQLGLGHLVRCRELARELKDRGERNVMVGPGLDYMVPMDKKIFDYWVPVSDWADAITDSRRFIDIFEEYNGTAAVIDDYRIDEDYQLTLFSAGVRWLQFELEPRQNIWADIILNANPAARKEDYFFVSKKRNACFLMGPKYAILRSQFKNIEFTDKNRELKRIFIAFGAGDDLGATTYVINALNFNAFNNVEIVVVVGKYNENIEEIRMAAVIHSSARIEIHVDPVDMVGLMASCDLAITSGGTLTYELAATKNYMLIIAISKNQVKAAAWEKLGCAKYLGEFKSTDSEQLTEKIRIEVKKNLLESVWHEKYNLVDGLGASRVAKQLITN